MLAWQAYAKGYLEGHADAADGQEYHRDAASEGANQWCIDYHQEFVDAMPPDLTARVKELEEAVAKARYHLHEGLTAALPSDDRGWMVRRRFELAEAALNPALTEQEIPS